MVHKEVSRTSFLLNNISSFLSLSAIENFNSNPAIEYYIRGVDISKILKPVLQNLITSDSAPDPLINDQLKDLAQFFDELTKKFESWQDLSSRICYVVEIESLVSKLQDSSVVLFQLMKHNPRHLHVEECIKLMMSVPREKVSDMINEALKDQKKSVGPTTSEVLVTIAETTGLRSNNEVMIEGVVLSNMKQNTDNKTEAEYLEGLVSLVTQMHDYLSNEKQAKLHIPSELCCSLSLELMNDPVTVATGETYERVFIEKWIEMGLMFCPITRQALCNTSLTSNTTVKASITSWCEANNLNPPDPLELIQSSQAESHWHHPLSSNSSIETEAKKLVEQLKSSSLDSQREATARIRILSKDNTDNRNVIVRCGALKSLINLLYSKDERTQANAVTCLLNLSINENNKSAIAESEVIEPLIHVLETGYIDEAKGNAAVTLSNLSTIEKYNKKIGREGVIEPLVDLLGHKSLSVKNDAAKALVSISTNHENLMRVIRAGGVRLVVEMMDPAIGMMEKAVVLLSNLATVKEGKIAIADAGGIQVLVEVVEIGSPRAKENATAALWHFCMVSPRFINSVLREGVIPPLVALSKSGTDRAKEKAQSLLQYFEAQKQRRA